MTIPTSNSPGTSAVVHLGKKYSYKIIPIRLICHPHNISSEVNLYYDPTGQRQVVIKCIDLHTNKIELTKVMKEIYILAKLDHPRIIRFLGVFEYETKINIIMEYAPNGNLSDLIELRRKKGVQFNESEILRFFCDLLMGVNYLHIRNIIHRDLKPENVLLDWNFRVKIADFGVSKIFPGTDHNTALTDGTPLYMAPELFHNYPYNYKSDVWSLGVIFYEMATLELPFVGRDINELYSAVNSGRYRPIDCVGKGFDTRFGQICKMMLTPSPVQRCCLNAIVCHPLIVDRYYNLFFEI